MTVTAKITRTLSVPGGTLRGTVSRVGTDSDAVSVSLPVGKDGTITTKPTNNTCTITLSTPDHGFYPGQLLCLHITREEGVYTYFNTEVTSLFGDVIGLDITNGVNLFDGAEGGVTLADHSVSDACIVSQQYAFDLSNIVDQSELLVMALQTAFSNPNSVPNAFYSVWYNDSSHTIVSLPPNTGSIYDVDATLQNPLHLIDLDFPLTDYVYGIVSNPTSSSPVTVRVNYLNNDIGS